MSEKNEQSTFFYCLFWKGNMLVMIQLIYQKKNKQTHNK